MIDSLPHLVIYLVIGTTTGFLGGLLGIGGGLIVVPALIFLFEWTNLLGDSNVTVTVAVGTAMASMTFTAVSATISQHNKNNIDWRLVTKWVPTLSGGALLASCFAEMVPANVIKTILAVILGSSATLLLWNRFPTSNRDSPSALQRFLIAATSGGISGLVGLGGGNFVVPSLLYFNTSVVRAIAVASVGGIGIATLATTGYVITGWDESIPQSLGYIYLPAFIPIAMMNVICAPIGVAVGHKISTKRLQQIFGTLMILVSLRLFLSVTVG